MNITNIFGLGRMARIKDHLIINKETLSSKEFGITDVDMCRNYILELSTDYPDIGTWFDSRVVPGLSTGERSIIIKEHAGHVAGIAIIKKTAFERKICSVRVLPGFEGRGYGPSIFAAAMLLLGDNRPLVTVSDRNITKYERIFSFFGYKYADSYPHFYTIGANEIAFNGALQTEKHFKRAANH